MPRKRATRAQTTRAKPQLKNSDEDELVKEMTAAERKAKLENIIKDFDVNVENIRKQYEEELEAMENEIDKHFYHIRCKLSSMELKMTVEDYIDFTLSEEGEKENTETTSVSRPTSELASIQKSKNTLSKYRSRQMIETIPEEGGTGGQHTTVKKPPRRGPTSKAQGVTFNAEPHSSHVPNSFVTPAMQRNIATTGWGATPLVTPKFDPRLPITPANSRQVKPGEVVMSLAGSPVNVENNSRSKTLVLQNGEEIDVEIPDRADIHDLMSTLREIMKKGKDM